MRLTSKAFELVALMLKKRFELDKIGGEKQEAADDDGAGLTGINSAGK